MLTGWHGGEGLSNKLTFNWRWRGSCGWVGGCDDEVHIKFFYCTFFIGGDGGVVVGGLTA